MGLARLQLTTILTAILAMVAVVYCRLSATPCDSAGVNLALAVTAVAATLNAWALFGHCSVSRSIPALISATSVCSAFLFVMTGLEAVETGLPWRVLIAFAAVVASVVLPRAGAPFLDSAAGRPDRLG
jgi:hypothetical protein